MESVSMNLAKPHTIRWTRQEYHKMAEAGLFSRRRVELLRGEIIERTPQDSLHATGMRLVNAALSGVFAAGYVVSVQLPLDLGLDSSPEPDITVARGALRDFADSHPTSALLVVEVAGSSLEYDRTVKASLYAEAGIQDYWILNLVDRQLEVFRDPVKDAGRLHGYAYSDRAILPSTTQVSPLELPGTVLRVADMLP